MQKGGRMDKKITRLCGPAVARGSRMITTRVKRYGLRFGAC
jgi:hypothetical protein